MIYNFDFEAPIQHSSDIIIEVYLVNLLLLRDITGRGG